MSLPKAFLISATVFLNFYFFLIFKNFFLSIYIVQLFLYIAYFFQ